MYRSFLVVCARRIILDSLTNQLSVIDIFEGLKSQGFPIVVPSLSALFYLRRDESDPDTQTFTLRCTVGEIEILATQVEVRFEVGITARSIINFEGFLIPSPGILRLELFQGQSSLGSFELPIEKLEAPSPTVRVSPVPAGDV